jgi:outer membrane protein OmpA-like peptidoglycan-associated protein
MNKNLLIALPLAATLILPAAAQTSTQNSTDQAPAAQSQQNSQISTGISNQPATDPLAGSASNDNLGPHQPLQPDTKEGFWGKLNPFARKKYVQRQVAPIRDRVNELDELTANNTKMLKDVDARATAGIQMASNRAGEADQKAMLAGQHAQEANTTAQAASTRLHSVEQVVGNIDDYKSTGSAELKFRAGQTTLSKSSKEEIDQMVSSLANQRGYVIQVQGFSPGRGQEAIQSSQTMAQAVARYLVVEHQIPVYRIFVVGMGNAPVQSADGQAKKVRGGRVEVSVLKNGLDQLQQSASVSAPSQGGAAGAAYNSGAPATSDNAPANAVGNSAQQAPWQKSSTPQQPQQQQQQQNQQPK